jgi:hypothetical protein
MDNLATKADVAVCSGRIDALTERVHAQGERVGAS